VMDQVGEQLIPEDLADRDPPAVKVAHHFLEMFAGEGREPGDGFLVDQAIARGQQVGLAGALEIGGLVLEEEAASVTGPTPEAGSGSRPALQVASRVGQLVALSWSQQSLHRFQ
jgi:hypothetical protein